MAMTKPDCKTVWKEYDADLSYKAGLNLFETVKTNENFFIGKQWEGVKSNGLPTPVFNFLKRVVLFQVASITTDNIKIQASALPGNMSGKVDTRNLANVVNDQFNVLLEHNKIATVLREYMRNAAVDGDSCLYSYWDADVETGNTAKGAIVTEVIDNTRVHFGNRNSRNVQKQPFIILSAREMVDAVRDEAKANGCADWETVQADSDNSNIESHKETGDKVTTLLKLWRNKETGTIWAYKCTKTTAVKKAWDTKLKRYPITWLNWDYVQDCYHGMSMITGLIPNQIFVNKLFAMTMLSLMTSAYPKVVYDATRVKKWDNRVGAAIPVTGGDMNGVARIIDPAQVSPQISQFIELAVEYTQSFLGATSVALGDTRPDNTSAIVALQRSSAVPMEITKQNLYQSIEDLGNIYMDFMRVYYGKRMIEQKQTVVDMTPMGVPVPSEQMVVSEFDFGLLEKVPMSLKLDIGASAYWSEIASIQTLDNLLTQNKIDLVSYLERIPEGYISKKQELIDQLKNAEKAQTAPAPGGAPTANRPAFPTSGNAPEDLTGGGYGTLQRAINESAGLA